jgi:hypothetical protein
VFFYQCSCTLNVLCFEQVWSHLLECIDVL